MNPQDAIDIGREAIWTALIVSSPMLVAGMVVAAVMVSMGMLMLPPILISLPFNLLLFVLVDGWHLVVGMLMESFQVFS